MRFLALLTAALLTPALALAQTTMDYRPFRPGHSYYYASGPDQDSLVSARLASATVVNGDSVWSFREVVVPCGATTQLSGCFGPTSCDFQFRADAEFGAKQIALGNGTYGLITAAGDTFRLRTRGALLSSWPFTATITATLQRRSIASVALADSAVQDSTLLISLSTGQMLGISKNYGLVAGPSLWTGSPQGQLALYAIPERNLGLPPTHPWRIYDFQPGDEFAYRTRQEGGFGTLCWEEFEQKRVLSRAMSPNGDTLIYMLLEQTQRNTYSSGPNNPFCGGSTPVGNVLYPVRTTVLRVPRRWPSPYTFVPGPGEYYSFGSWGATINEGVRKTAFFSGCVVRFHAQISNRAIYDTCARALVYGVDRVNHTSYAEGLGEVRDDAFNNSHFERRLVWYQKDGVPCGPRTGFPILLAVSDLLPERAVHLYPNPATESARLSLTTTKGGPLTLTVTDALGRLTWRRQTTIGADAEVALPTASWPRGVYLVRVQLPEGARTLRLVLE